MYVHSSATLLTVKLKGGNAEYYRCIKFSIRLWKFQQQNVHLSLIKTSELCQIFYRIEEQACYAHPFKQSVGRDTHLEAPLVLTDVNGGNGRWNLLLAGNTEDRN